jgi:hypothetical protein
MGRSEKRMKWARSGTKESASSSKSQKK